MSNFDGAIHRATTEWTNPNVWAANKAAVPDDLSGLLQESYVYAREHAQGCGVRTFNPAAAPLSSSGPLNIAIFPSIYVPPHATAIVVEFRYNHDGSMVARGYHKVRLSGTPDIETDEVEGMAPAAGVPVTDVLDIPTVLSCRVVVPLDDDALAASGINRDDIALTASAYALYDTGATAADYRPMSVSVFWVSEY